MPRRIPLLSPLLLATVLACGAAGDPSAAPRVARSSARPSAGAEAVVQVLASGPQGPVRGTGFIVDPQGIVLTTLHGVEGAGAILVRLPADGTYYRARLFAADREHDTAALKLEISGLPRLEFAATDVVPVGARVTALGDGIAAARVPGVVEGLRFDGSYSFRVSNRLPPGSSGAPVVDESGQVIGMAVTREGEDRNLSAIIPNIYVRDLWSAPTPAGESGQPMTVATESPPGLAVVLERESRMGLPGPTEAQAADLVPASAEATGGTPPLPTAATTARSPTPAPDPEAGARQSVKVVAPRVRPGPVPPATDTPARRATRSVRTSGFDLTGRWDLINTIERSSFAPYEGLQLGFRLSLEQRGDSLFGRGEKWLEDGRTLAAGARSPISIRGLVKNGRVRAGFVEAGARRTVSGSFDWSVLFEGRAMQGRFSDSAANSRGTSTAARVD